MWNVGVSSESASAGGDPLLYRYVVREVGQMSTSTVDACRVGSVACAQLNYMYIIAAHFLLVHFLVTFRF